MSNTALLKFDNLVGANIYIRKVSPCKISEPSFILIRILKNLNIICGHYTKTSSEPHLETVA